MQGATKSDLRDIRVQPLEVLSQAQACSGTQDRSLRMDVDTAKACWRGLPAPGTGWPEATPTPTQDPLKSLAPRPTLPESFKATRAYGGRWRWLGVPESLQHHACPASLHHGSSARTIPRLRRCFWMYARQPQQECSGRGTEERLKIARQWSGQAVRLPPMVPLTGAGRQLRRGLGRARATSREGQQLAHRGVKPSSSRLQ